jgi:hypothetical protein
MRFIAIGDIHGCATEFEQLLERLSPTKDDRLILLGDLINRGPDSPRVLELARRSGALALLGNHEARLRDYRRTKDISLIKKEDYDSLARLRATDWDYIEQMKLSHYEKDIDTVFVHAGFLPGVAWQDQGADILTRIQMIDPHGTPRKRSECDKGKFWADMWEGPPFVVYGHTPRPSVYKSKWAIGIDTGCVLGGHLTALILPEKRFVQVSALKSYHKAKNS